MNPTELAKALRRVVLWHDQQARKSGFRFRGAARGQPRTIPYGIHPIWAAMMLFHETDLPQELRWEGAMVLLFHDILEDTKVPPARIPRSIREFVRQMSFSTFDEEMERLWERQPFIRLLKLFDKVSNWTDGQWMYPKRRALHRTHLQRLADDVEQNFGTLNIVRIARTLAEGP